jgi:hypothetical protein
VCDRNPCEVFKHDWITLRYVGLFAEGPSALLQLLDTFSEERLQASCLLLVFRWRRLNGFLSRSLKAEDLEVARIDPWIFVVA